MGGPLFSPAQKEQALSAYILNYGNSAAAERDLAAAGVKIKANNIRRWADEMPEEMDRIAHELAPRMREARARGLDALSVAAMEVAVEGVGEMRGKMGDLDLRDIPGATRNMATTAAIAVDKASVARGEVAPTVNIDVKANLNFLKRVGVIEGEAEEIPAAKGGIASESE